MQDEPAAQSAEHAFQAHDEARDGGVQLFLPQNLQRIADAAGQHTTVDNGQPVGAELGEGGRLKQEGGGGALHRHHNELHQTQPDAIHQRGKVVDGHDLEAEEHGAAEQDPVAGFDAAKAVLHAEQIQPAHGDDHAQPEPGTAPPPHEQPEHRHHHDVHRRQERGLGRGRVQRNADLLGRAGRKQKGAADKARCSQRFAVGSGLRPAGGFAPAAAKGVKGVNGGQEHQHGQPAPPGQKGIGPHAGACALGHKGRAPDQGAEHQHQGMPGLCIHPPIPSTLSSP